jgi:serine/threonine-protein kinase
MKPADAAAMVETLALTVHHAHRHSVIHRDLKPHNVLLTTDGTPKLTDFGLAKRLDEDHSQTLAGAIMGTPAYMAPEQADSKGKVGPAADIYGLGAILYELLTGRPPFKAATVVETVRQVVDLDQRAVSPRRLQVSTPKDLDTICMKCLEKVPSKRYASAADLAEDLRRFREGEPIRARPLGWAGRLWRWCGRHPVASCSGATALAIMIVFILGVMYIARARQENFRKLAVRKIASDARHVASTVLLRLQAVGMEVERAAASDTLRELIRAGDKAGLRTLCKGYDSSGRVQAALHGSAVNPVASWMVMDPTGAILAVSHDEKVKSWMNPGRDYFDGAISAYAAAGRPVIHVSRGYRSQNQGLDKFALSTVVIDPRAEEKLLGVLVMTMTTGASLGSRFQDVDQELVLALPRDTNDPARKAPHKRSPAEYLLVVHPSYRPRQEPVQSPPGDLPDFKMLFGHELAPPRDQGTLHPTDDYRDPVAAIDPDYAGRWWAGFAPVGNTEMVVIVQQSEARALAADQEVLWQLRLLTIRILGGGLALCLVLVTVQAIRRRRVIGSMLWRPRSPAGAPA